MNYAEDWGHDIIDADDYMENEPIMHEIQFICLVHTSPLAYLVKLDDGKKHWLPISQCNMIDDDGDNGGTIEVPEWLLDKKGIEYGY